MSSYLLDEECPACGADITFGKAHTDLESTNGIWIDGEFITYDINKCPVCAHEWELT